MARPGDRQASALGKHGYKQIKKIGEGSFGAAILVQHDKERDKDATAIAKMIDISRATKQERDDAVKESKVLAALKHPYVVRYRESFHEDGWLCIVMDYCEGGDLGDRVKKMRQSGRSFPQEQVVRWFTQSILALKYIHDMHILHRDLKSGNFFLSKSGNIKMGDFGIAKVLECTAACAQTQIGTPYYLSPEICQGRAYSWGSDIWSMGCILYEMCARRVPFDAPDLKTLIKKITAGPTPDLPSEYSSGLRSLLKELLDRDSTKRPQATEILKRPVVQEMVRRMLDEVQEVEQESARPAASEASAAVASKSEREGGSRSEKNSARTGEKSSARNERDSGSRSEREREGVAKSSRSEASAAPSAKDSAGKYQKHQQVEFYSQTHKEWLPAQVSQVDAEGRIILNVKPNVWLSIEVQRERVRPKQEQQASAPEKPPSSHGDPRRAGERRSQEQDSPNRPRDRHPARQPSKEFAPLPSAGKDSARGGDRDRDSARDVHSRGGRDSGRDRGEVARQPSAGGQRNPSPRHRLDGGIVPGAAVAGGGAAAVGALRRGASQDRMGRRPSNPLAPGTPSSGFSQNQAAGRVSRQPSRGGIFG